MIIGIDKAKGKDYSAFYHFGFGGKLVVNDEMDDVSDKAKDAANKLTEKKK